MPALARLRSQAAVPVLVLCAALLALVPAALAAGDNGLIVFQGNRGGPPAVFTVKPDGSDQVRLGSGLQPSISRDGKRIVFVRSSGVGAELWVLNTGNGKVERITDDAKGNTQPAISPDGSQIVFVGLRRDGGDSSEREHLYLIDADGSNERELTSGQKYTDREPSFSPDGKRIVFVRSYNAPQLMTITVGGEDLTPLTDRDEPFAGPEAPSYSPDGDRILFGASARGGDRIWTIGAGGNGLDQVTKGDDEGLEPAYSPDGGSIVFRRGRELWTMAADGGGARQLAEAPEGSNLHPSWGR